MRFSSKKQEFGDSMRRQIEKRDKFLVNTDLDLELDTSLDMEDLGVSGFDGSNVEKGALGAFLTAVETGRVRKGSYLLIENLDRLSRQDIEKSMHLLLGILKKGINIITLSDERVIKAGQLSFAEMIPVMVELERAHKESARKSELIGSAWKNKKAALLESKDHKKLTKWCPKWLELSEDRKSYIVNKERVKLIVQILKWVVKGYGSSKIIQMLEDLNIDPWESNAGVKSEKRIPKRWHLSMIQRIVRNRALLGEYELKQKDPATQKVSTQIISDYYPNVLKGEENLFYEAQIARTSRDELGGDKRTSGNRGKTFSNLFAGIAVCGYSIDGNSSNYRCVGDREPMVYVNKGPKSPIKYLQCGRIKGGNRGCEECSKLWRYDHFESAFLHHITDIDVSELSGSVDDLNEEIKNLDVELYKLQDELETSKKMEKNIVENIKRLMAEGESISSVMNETANEVRDRIQSIPNEVRKLKSARKVKANEKSNPERIKSELFDLIGMMQGCTNDDELYDIRTQLSMLIGRVVDHIEVYTKGVFFTEQRLQQQLAKFPEKYAQERDKYAEEVRREEQEKQKRDKRGKRHVGFFIVKYKSGESRLIQHHPEDPRSLVQNIKWDDSGLKEPPQIDNTMVKLWLKGVKSKDKDWRN